MILQRHGSRVVLENLRECFTASPDAFSKKRTSLSSRPSALCPPTDLRWTRHRTPRIVDLCQEFLPNISPRPPANRAKMRTPLGSRWSPVEPLKMPEKRSQLSRYVRSSGVEGERESGPYCMACWDGDEKLVNVMLLSGNRMKCGRCAKHEKG